jgi:hypothetical protein
MEPLQKSPIYPGNFSLIDSQGETRTGHQSLVPITVIKNGSVYRLPKSRYTNGK